MNGVELNAISTAGEPLGPDRRIAIAYALELEHREKAVRNLRIPATGLSMLAGLKAISSLQHDGILQAMILWSNMVIFSIAWLMNVTDRAYVNFIRQGLFIVPRVTSFVYEILLAIKSGKDKSGKAQRWAEFALIIIAIIVNLINIAMIIKAKVIDRNRNIVRYKTWTLRSHLAFTLHAILLGVGMVLDPKADKNLTDKTLNTWVSMLILCAIISNIFQYIIYTSSDINPFFVELAKDPTNQKGASGLYLILLQAIFSGSLDPTDLISWFKGAYGNGSN